MARLSASAFFRAPALGHVAAEAAIAEELTVAVVGRLRGERPQPRLAAGDDLEIHLVQRFGVLHQADDIVGRALVFGAQHVEHVGEMRALQQGQWQLCDRGEALGHVDQMPFGVGLPQPVAGVLLKIFQQQRDDLGLALELKLGLEIAKEQIALRDDVARHEEREQQQEHGGHEVRPGAA
ncbi:hypothetical protein ACVWZK_005372 [Bradyrhizobium sp. GM0.4]